MYWLLLVICSFVVVITWSALLAVILRPWIRLPILWWNRQERKVALQQLTSKKYIFLVGVCQWGWGCFLGLTLFDYLRARYGGERTLDLTPLRLLGTFVTWSLAGIWYGWMQRNSSQALTRYNGPDSQLH